MRKFIIIALSLFASSAWADEVWVTNEKDDTVSIIDLESEEVVRTIELGKDRVALRLPMIILLFMYARLTAIRFR